MKKNNRSYGYNVYGQRCEVRTVKVNPENALEQCMKIMDKIEIAQAEGRKLEYTLDFTAIPREEAIRIHNEMDRRAKMRNYFKRDFVLKH